LPLGILTLYFTRIRVMTIFPSTSSISPSTSELSFSG
jgi:hypothetical protein